MGVFASVVETGGNGLISINPILTPPLCLIRETPFYCRFHPYRGNFLPGICDCRRNQLASLVVGYQTKTVYSYCSVSLGIQFQPCSGVDSIVVSNLIQGVDFYGTTDFDNCDQIWRYDADDDKWVKYGYHRVSNKAYRWQRWTPKTETWDEIDDATDVCMSGDVILFTNNSEDDYDITLNGAVKPFGVSPAYTIYSYCSQFIAYPWPVAIKVTSIPNYITYGDLYGTTDFDNCDQIWRYDDDDDKWVKYAYHRVSSKEYKWQRWTPKTETWSEIDDETDVIQAGQGFFFCNNAEDDKDFEFTYGD